MYRLFRRIRGTDDGGSRRSRGRGERLDEGGTEGNQGVRQVPKEWNPGHPYRKGEDLPRVD